MTNSTFADFAAFSTAHSTRFAHMSAPQVSTLTLVLTADTLAMRSAARASLQSRLESTLWGLSTAACTVMVASLAAALFGVAL
jgi:hypothetical protein